MEEIWKDIKGWEELYQISNFGRVKSLSKKVKDNRNSFRFTENRIIKPFLSTSGYYYIDLSRDKFKERYSIHGLVALHFVENQKNNKYINHKDGIKTNNNPNNLEFVTKSEDIKHAIRTGLMKPKSPMLGKFGKEHHNSKKICQYTLDGVFIKTYDGLADACRNNNIPIGTLGCSMSRNYKSCRGFIWKYFNEEQLKEAI